MIPSRPKISFARAPSRPGKLFFPGPTTQATPSPPRRGSAPGRTSGWVNFKNRLDKRSDSESNLKKAIDYGERAVSLDPARPLPKHNLQVARRKLESLRSQAFHQEVDKFLRDERFRDAIDLLQAQHQGARKIGSIAGRIWQQRCRLALTG